MTSTCAKQNTIRAIKCFLVLLAVTGSHCQELASKPHPDEILIAIVSGYLHTDGRGASSLEIKTAFMSGGLNCNPMPNDTAYLLSVESVPLTGGSKFVFSDTFTHKDLFKGSFHLYMGTSVLSPGIFDMKVTLSDAYLGLPIDDTLLAFRWVRNVECCPENEAESIWRKPDTRSVIPSAPSKDANKSPETTPSTFSGVFPTSQVAVVEHCHWVLDESGKRKTQVCPDRTEKGNLDKTPSFPGYNWWYDLRQPNSMHFYDLDKLYNDEYHGVDHVGPGIVKAYANHALNYCAFLLGRACTEVVDVGAARGYFSEGMRQMGANVLSIEGTASGVAACVERAGAASVVRRDLRLALDLGRRFDLATCTEVAEHIEPPFAGTLVQSLTAAADVVWFSSETPKYMGSIGPDNPDHLHHSNEQPDLFWDRLFLFFGYHSLALPESVVNAVGSRGRRVYYRAGATAFDQWHSTDERLIRESDDTVPVLDLSEQFSKKS